MNNFDNRQINDFYDMSVQIYEFSSVSCHSWFFILSLFVDSGVFLNFNSCALGTLAGPKRNNTKINQCMEICVNFEKFSLLKF